VADDDEVVCIATGTGFKELDHVDGTAAVPTIDRAALEETLAGLSRA
jgi:hypothetical protein